MNTLGPRTQWPPNNWSKARVAVMTAISRNRSAVIAAISQTDIEEIEGRLTQIVIALKQRNVILLPGGTLERYLPKYAGDHYELTEAAKRKAVVEEIEEMARPMTPAELATYGDLYQAVCALPSKVSVDVERVLRDYLSRYIHDLQAAVVSNPTWLLDQVRAHLNTIQKATIKVFFVQELNRGPGKESSVLSLQSLKCLVRSKDWCA